MRIVEGTADVEDVDDFLDRLAKIGAGGEDGEGSDCAVQAFDARYVAGEDHLESAVAHANRAFERGENVARDRSVEILLYAAGRRQINQALTMGVGEGEQQVAVVVDSEAREPRDADEATAESASERGERASENDSEARASKNDGETNAAAAASNLLEPGETLGVGTSDPETLRDFFDVTDAELAATDAGLEALVCERVALLDVEK